MKRDWQALYVGFVGGALSALLIADLFGIAWTIYVLVALVTFQSLALLWSNK